MAWNPQETYNELPPLPPTPTLPETLGCREALLAGSERMRHRDLSVGIATVICSEITGISMNVRRLVGTRIGNPVTGEIVYAPPEGRDEILVKLKNWEDFLPAGDDLDPIVRMATAHYQFEAIHPFTNGNQVAECSCRGSSAGEASAGARESLPQPRVLGIAQQVGVRSVSLSDRRVSSGRLGHDLLGRSC
jgi:hypothetical protein